jgi:hypothetical protein
MTLIRTFVLALLLLLAGAVVTFAQTEQAARASAQSDPTITVSISARGVRFVALGQIKQMRLEVFTSSGEPLYNSELQAGNVRDWTLEDKQGQHLSDGSYLCMVTVRDLSGRLDMKQGTVLMGRLAPSRRKRVWRPWQTVRPRPSLWQRTTGRTGRL